MTEASPVDHRHHYGFSVAIPEVNGTSFWGGRTFVRDVGPTLLPNHGQQVSAPVTPSSAPTGTLDDTVTWLDQHGAPLLSERRSIEGSVLPGADGWSLRWTSDLVADRGDLTITSPGATGRPGAGYGGLFWRSSPADETVVLSHGGEGESTAHGSRSPWVALAQRRGDSWTTLLLVQPGGPSPWFVRAATFPGAGPALSWDAPLTVEAGQTLRLDLTAVLLDRRLDLRAAGALAEEHSCVQ
jgi:LacI family transcriptional regulator